jgi:hypothetical protein
MRFDLPMPSRGRASGAEVGSWNAAWAVQRARLIAQLFSIARPLNSTKLLRLSGCDTSALASRASSLHFL